ncbi:MAG: hypothetical protein QOD25_3959, partial [Alphaproteobacteria bacterium]|nr:hypothetical protein [Alphaproteobacteria bacterium]
PFMLHGFRTDLHRDYDLMKSLVK